MIVTQPHHNIAGWELIPFFLIWVPTYIALWCGWWHFSTKLAERFRVWLMGKINRWVESKLA